jgi:hypothetical protein
MLESTYHLDVTSQDAVGEGTIGELEKVFIPVMVSATLPVFFTTPFTREFHTVCVRESPLVAFSTHSHHENQYTIPLTIKTESIERHIFFSTLFLMI